MSKNTLRIIPLGGLGEIGKNMTAYEYDGDILIVDAGIMFPLNDMLGVDYIIPDFQYLLDKTQRVRGIVITHGHEDHIGAVHHVLDAIPSPVYATPLTLGLIEGKLARSGRIGKSDLRRVQAGETVQIGKFKVETFHICHSIPDAIGLGITTGAGLVIHMSDFKLDQTPVDGWVTDYAKLAEFSRRGVDLLLSDSTNSERPGWTPGEGDRSGLRPGDGQRPRTGDRGYVCFADLAHSTGGRLGHEIQTQNGLCRQQHGGECADCP